mgnify:FL=1
MFSRNAREGEMMIKMFHRFLQAMLMIVIMFTFVDIVNAQCPQGKAAVIWVNGILGESQAKWEDSVRTVGDKFFATHITTLNPSCVEFVPVYNTSAWAYSDINQSLAHLMQFAVDRINLIDLDMLKLLRVIEDYSKDGYKVVLVGHSQGSLYTNLAYQFIRSGSSRIIVPSIASLPDNSKLEIVNIATPSDRVSDGNGRYTTQCGDIILTATLGLSLPANINGEGRPCSAQLPTSYKHSLDTYLILGTNSQRQIFADLDLALRLPDSGCVGTPNCILKDNFSDGSFVANFITNPYEPGSIKEESGALQMSAGALVLPGTTVTTQGKISARTRRVFSGTFNASFRWNFIQTGNSHAKLNFVRTSDNNSIFESNLFHAGWNTLEINRTDTQVSVSRNGSVVGQYSSAKNDEYYLDFELQSDSTNTIASTLLLDDLLVVAPPTPTPTPVPTPTSIPTMTFTPTTKSLSVEKGNSITANLTLKSQGGMTGQPNFQLRCAACPTGFSYNFTRGFSVTLPADGSVQVSITFSPSSSASPGTWNFEYWAIMSDVTAKAYITLNVSGSPAPVPASTTSCTFGRIPALSWKSNLVTLRQSNGAGAISYNSNGVNLSGNTFSFTPTGDIGAYTASFVVTATDATGKKATTTCTVPVVAGKPVLTSLRVNTSPKVNTNINVSIFGTGFMKGAQAYVCSSTATSSCVATSTTYINGGTQLTLTSVRRSTAGTIYIMVKNPGDQSSKFLTMVVVR